MYLPPAIALRASLTPGPTLALDDRVYRLFQHLHHTQRFHTTYGDLKTPTRAVKMATPTVQAQ